MILMSVLTLTLPLRVPNLGIRMSSALTPGGGGRGRDGGRDEGASVREERDAHVQMDREDA